MKLSTLTELNCNVPQKLTDRLRACSKEMQMLPEAAANALQLLQDPDCSIRDFATIVEKDATLATSILSLANSPFYRSGSPVGNIHQAVVTIGFRQCSSLIQASCANALMERLSEDQSESKRALLIHSQIVASCATELCTALRLNFCGMEFTAGILHDVGRLILSQLVPDDYLAVDRFDFNEKSWTAEDESNELQTDHCSIGGMFAVINSLPDEICEAIRFHHEPQRAKFSPLLTAVTAAADDFANYAMQDDKSLPYQHDENYGLQILLERPEVNTEMTLLDCAAEILPQVLRFAPTVAV